MNNYFIETNQDHLEHHGVLGQKWGVRRYQNYDGSYTRAGLKRYNSSLNTYKMLDDSVKDLKRKKKNGEKETFSSFTSDGKASKKEITREVTKNDIHNMKRLRNTAKRQLNKDYKHLKQDKMADQGKELYSKGKTITGNNNLTYNVLTASGLAVAGSQYLRTTGLLDKKIATIIATSGAAASGAAYIKQYIFDEYHNKRLRAYYSHTSNY